MGMREKLIDLAHDYFDSVPWYADIADLNPEELIDHLIANGVTIPVRCKDCKHWLYMEDGFGDCTNSRFHLENHADPTMKADDFCSCGERRTDDR